MSFRECAHDELRKNRNDLIFIKDNLLIPEDIDRGPTEDMININDIIIPPWVRVCEIPTNVEGVSDQRKEFIDVIDECTKLIDATYAMIKPNDSIPVSNNAIFYDDMRIYMDYLQKTYALLERAGSLIPVNFNMYLIRVVAYANVIAGRAEPVITQLITLFENDTVLSTLIRSEDVVTGLYNDMREWKTVYEDAFRDGVYCVDYDTSLSLLASKAAELLSRANTVILKISTGSYNYDDLKEAIMDVQSSLHKVTSANYHLERSKAPLICFTGSSSYESDDYIPSLPYDYVHQRYYIEIEDKTNNVVDETPHILEHSHRMIGDYIF